MNNPTRQSVPVTPYLDASFRDPAGFVFRNKQGKLLRQINAAGTADFDHFMACGLYDQLVQKGWLVSHKKLSIKSALTHDAHAVIQPQPVPFISYPFEWSFSQLQDAALLTLAIQKTALEHGMTLKDASAYNVQFVDGRPIFIDTLSFEKYQPGTPWQAYRQFCQHFLAPLVLMAHISPDMSQLSRIYLDGVPLDLAARLLPRHTKVRPGLAMHIVLHAKVQKAKESTHQKPTKSLTQTAQVNILDSLERTIRKLRPLTTQTEWGDYYDQTNYTAAASDQKAKLIKKFTKPLGATTALDLGGNNGAYSRVLNQLGMFTVCTDIDPNAVEANYRLTKQAQTTDMLPLLVDLTNPGGALGWRNSERSPIHERLRCDVVMALALIHHLVISNNLPMQKVAEYFSQFGPWLLIEFVPKTDSQVQKLLATRPDIFPDYTEAAFEQAFANHYRLQQSAKIPSSQRTLYLFRRK